MQNRVRFLFLGAAMLLLWGVQGQSVLTVYDDPGSNFNVPFSGDYADGYLNCQMLYPAAELDTMSGGIITSLTFYPCYVGNWSAPQFEVYMTEDTLTSISSLEPLSHFTLVWSGALTGGSGAPLTLTLSTPYTYHGGNLLIAVVNAAMGTYSPCSWYGKTVAGACYQGYSYSSFSHCGINATQRNFLPKTTFGYVGGSLECSMVRNLHYANLTDTSVSVSWQAGGTESQWELVITPAVNGDSVFIANSSQYSIHGLLPNTHYAVRVKAICSATESSFVNTLYFTTTCTPITHDELPYTYGFEDASLDGRISPCWRRSDAGVSGSNYIVHTGSRSIELTASSPSSCGYLVLPVFADPISSLQLKYWVNRSFAGYSGRVLVGVVDDPDSVRAFTRIASVEPPEGIVGWAEMEVNLNSYAGTGRYICLKADYDGDYNVLNIDDVTVQPLPACLPPEGLVLDSLSVNWAAVSWQQEGSPTNWVIEYDTIDFVPGTLAPAQVRNVSSPYCILTGLEPGRQYYLYVRANCNGNPSQYRRITFATRADYPAGLPYFCDFEEDGNNGWDLFNGNQINAWRVGPAAHNGPGTRGLYISNNNGASNTYTAVTQSYTMAARSLELLDMGEYVFSYDWRCQGESFEADFCRAFLVPVSYEWTAGAIPGGTTNGFANFPVPSDWIDLTVSGTLPNTMAQQNAWTTAEGYFRPHAPGIYWLAFVWANDEGGGSNPPIAIDNVSLFKSTCSQVRNLAASHVTSDTIVLTWSPGGNEVAWIVSDGFSEVVVNDTVYTLSNLDANTLYEFKVYAICGVGDTSLASTIAVRTICGVTWIPFVENFDSYDAYSYPGCWHSVAHAVVPQVTPNYGVSLQFDYDAAAASPALPYSLNTLLVSFDLRKEANSSGVIHLGWTTDPYLSDSIHVLYTINPRANLQYTNYEFDFSADTNLASAVADISDEVYLVWSQYGSAGGSYWLDNVAIEEAGGCVRPSHVMVEASRADSVHVSWIGRGDAAAWQIYVGTSAVPPVGENVNAIDVWSAEYTFTNLVGGNTYYLFVRSNCGSGFGSWTNPVMFVPGTVNMPVTGSRDVVACETVVYDDGGASGQYANDCNGYLTVYPASPNSLIRFYGSCITESAYFDYMVVYGGVGTSGSVLFDSRMLDTPSGIAANIDTLTSDVGPITIYFHSDGSSQYDGFEIHISCVPAPECGHVQNLVAAAGVTTAILEWEVGSIGDYVGAEIRYRPTDSLSAQWMTRLVDYDNFAVLTGLSPNTAYTAEVSALCGSFMASSQAVTFVTAESSSSGCVAPVVVATAVTASGVDVSWAPGGAETTWGVYHRAASAAHYTYDGTEVVPRFTFADLLPGTNYDFMIVARCSETDSAAATLRVATECAAIDSLPFTEDFNTWGVGTGVIPQCWSREGSHGTNGYISSSYNRTGSTGGSYYTYANSGTGYTTFLTLPPLDTTHIRAANCLLSFSAYNPSPSVYAVDYAVGVMTDPTDAASFVSLDTVHVGLANAWEVFEVPLDGYAGNGAYVAIKSVYVTHYGFGYIDDLSLEQIPTCPRPDSLYAANATSASVDLGWRERGSAAEWQIEYGPIGFELGTGTTVVAIGNPYTLTGLPGGYMGEFYVRSICGSADTGCYSRESCRFGTLQVPAELPYVCTFEDASEWNRWQSLANGAIGWSRGTADAFEGSHSMYVSADNGVSAGVGSLPGMVKAFAYRDIDFGAVDSTCVFSFKVKFGGNFDGRYDGLDVYIVEPSALVYGDAGSSVSETPWGHAGALRRVASCAFDTAWRTVCVALDTIHDVRRVVFYCHSQNTAGGGSFAEVDSLSVDYAPCPRPISMQFDEGWVRSTEARLSWSGFSSAQYRVCYRRADDSVFTSLLCNTNSVILTGLDPLTDYVARVQKICGADSSQFSDDCIFTTALCDEALIIGTGNHTGTSYCAPVNNYYNFSLSEVIVDSAELGGPQYIAAVSYYYDSHVSSAAKDNVRIYLQRTTRSVFGSGADAVAVDSTGVLVYSGAFDFAEGWNVVVFDTAYWYDGTGNLLVIVDDNSGAYSGSDALFGTSPCIGNKTLHFYSDIYNINPLDPAGSHESCSVEAWRPAMRFISCNSLRCMAPAVTDTSYSYSEVTVQWKGGGTNYEVALKPATVEVWPEEISVTDTFYTFSGLRPDVAYDIRIRQNCSANDLGYSDWTYIAIVTDDLPCQAPVGLAVNDATLTNTTAEFSWDDNLAASAWELHVWNTSSLDTIVWADSNSVSVSAFMAGVQYNAALRSVCDELVGVYSRYGDTIQFVAAACPDVNGVAVGEVTSCSVALSWIAVDDASQYEVEYGPANFELGTGVTLPAAINSITIAGLSPEYAYDFYVRALCGNDWYSEHWSARTTATTLAGEGIVGVDGMSVCKIYPNPASNEVELLLPGHIGAVRVEVLDLAGRVRQTCRWAEGGCHILSVSGLASGTYFVRIVGQTVSAIEKLVVE